MEIPEGVRQIKSYAFKWCGSLETIILPKSVTKIDEDFAVCCYNLKTIFFNDNFEAFIKFASAFDIYTLEEIFVLDENNNYINVLDLNDISGIIDTIIQENDTLTESMNNNDMEQFGKNINELRDLINQLKTAREKEKEEAKNDTTNTIVNNTVTNSIFSSYNEVVNTTR